MKRHALDPYLDLVPPSPAVLWGFFALMVPLPIVITAIALLQAFVSGVHLSLIADSVPMTWIGILGGIAVLTVPVWWVLHRLLRRHVLTVGTDNVEIVTTFYRRTLGIDELDLDRARVVDLDERTELRPMLKTNGNALPGFRSGWFRLRSRSKAFVAMASGPRVLWIPTRRGYDLLLQPRQPQALLDRLRAMAVQTHRR